MKVLLLKDVYNLGRAGDVKKVANGYGRNFLLPQGLAMLATPGALKQAERIREEANKQRARLNEELGDVAEQISGIQLIFPARAGETGKLYGSVTTQMIADALSEKSEIEVHKRQIDSQPLRLLGMHTVKVRLTIDLIPEITVVIHREGESPESYMVPAEELAGAAEQEQEQQVEEIMDEQAGEPEAEAVAPPSEDEAPLEEAE